MGGAAVYSKYVVLYRSMRHTTSSFGASATHIDKMAVCWVHMSVEYFPFIRLNLSFMNIFGFIFGCKYMHSAFFFVRATQNTLC